MKKAIFGFNVHDITEIAMFCAIAILLDQFVKIQIGATGGSINIAMVPLFIIAIRHGWFKSLIAGGIVFGFISCFLDDYGLATYPLEYLVSYGSIAIMGIFAKHINKLFSLESFKKLIASYGIIAGCVLACAIIRFFAASIDSVILWDYGWIDAFVYNLPYVFFSALACLVVLYLLMPSIKVVNNIYKSTYIKSLSLSNKDN